MMRGCGSCLLGVVLVVLALAMLVVGVSALVGP